MVLLYFTVILRHIICFAACRIAIRGVRLTYRSYFRKYFFNLASIITVGFPFVGYKFLAGYIIYNSSKSNISLALFAVFSVWAIVDLLFNLVSLFSYLRRGRNVYPVCFLAYLCRRISFLKQWTDLGETLDMLFSFTIVACVVGLNLFVFINPLVPLWNISTVVNVLGAGIVRLGVTLMSANEENVK